MRWWRVKIGGVWNYHTLPHHHRHHHPCNSTAEDDEIYAAAVVGAGTDEFEEGGHDDTLNL